MGEIKKQISFTIILVFLISFSVKAHDGGRQLAFKENKNQWNDAVRFMGEIPGGTLFLEQQGLTYRLLNSDDLKDIHPGHTSEKRVLHGHVYKVDFLGSNPSAALTTEGKSATYFNYFLGNDPSRWASGVHEYQRVTYNNLYPDIDMSIYGKDYTLKYDLIVHPRGDVSAIQFRYRGADKIYLRNENLVIETSVGNIVEVKPFAYQEINGVKREVVCNYRLEGEVLSFDLPNGYKKNKDLIIDPVLIFSTYTGSTADEFGFTATYDHEGNMYLGGLVNANTGEYPVSPGAFQQTFGGGSNINGIAYPCDMSIMKLSSDGTNRIYATYIGGSDNEDPQSLIVNSLGQLCIYGRTYSSNFPTTNNAYSKILKGGSDIAVVVLSADGTALVGSTYIGGAGDDGMNYSPLEGTLGNLKYNYGDDARGEIIVDKQDNIYVASCTKSADFPVTAGCYQSIFGGGSQDGCMFKMNADASSLIFATYLGGNDDDAAYSMDLKSDNSIYITGGTMSTNFPSANNGVNKTYLGGDSDGFLAHLSADGKSLLHSTFIGTSAADQTYFVKLDLSENVYVTGQTLGAYPVINVNYSVPNSGQYITKFNPELSSVIYSTVFGNGNGKDNISPTAFLVDTCENVYVSGWGNNKLFQFVHTTDMTNMPLTDDAYQKTTDGTDFYIFVMRKDAESLLYGSYFGGKNSIEHVDGGTSRFDPKGVIYQAVCAGCGGNSLTPTTPNAWSTTNNSSNCNALGFKIQLNRIITRIKDSTYSGCAPLTVNFENMSVDTDSSYWDFGDGIRTSEYSPTHTYTSPGTYRVSLVGVNHATCNLYDTARATVTVLEQPTNTNFTITPENPFVKGTVKFTTSVNGNTFLWTVDDTTISHNKNAEQIYDTSGIHKVCLYINRNLECSDSVCKTFRVESKPMIDVPNAFSPNGDNHNDNFYVRGVGVASMTFKIFNRWGQKVFETNDINIGWDGKFKGVPQEMDVYAWELNATMDDKDGTRIVRNGNVTLIR